ncbi:uncharacterized protein LOC126786396 [Argentina anserina]|uniref:uncharacterized protein LOC126786396 n=1 Tax=Argentina anserina TaxID=57926 RepID=UPI00217686A1|nr:uncharacterized protein LOC126786396 [Potentilla anserina]
MSAIIQVSINSAFRLSGLQNDKPIKYCYLPRTKTAALKLNRFKLRAFRGSGSISGVGFLVKDEGWNWKKKREVVVRFNQGFGFNGGGGGGGKDDGTTARVLGNIAVAVGLTYLSFTGQLGWLLDAIVSIWLLAFLVPIVGLGAFMWWAGRDMVQDSCPNCGKDFQTFKSLLNDDMHQCPYCSQPFSVVDNKFVKDPANFSNRSTTFGQAFNDYTRSKTGKKDSSTAVVDIEAEVMDAD